MRNYRKEYDTFHGKPEQIKKRNKRNKARKMMVDALGRAAVNGKDVGHIKSLKSGGSNKRSNLRLESIKKNRGRK